jgi:hypothetical protein
MSHVQRLITFHSAGGQGLVACAIDFACVDISIRPQAFWHDVNSVGGTYL